MNKKVLIFLDADNIVNSIDLLEVAERLFSESVETYGLVSTKHLSKSEGYFDFLYEGIIHENDSYDSEKVTDYVERIHKTHQFDAILLPATFIGRMLAPRIAMRLHTGLVADVTDLKCETDNVEMIRPAFSGKIMAGIVNVGNGPIMMTIRQNVFQYSRNPQKKTQILADQEPVMASENLTILSVDAKNISYDIRDSEVLISGGGGAKQIFHRLEELSGLLKGNVSASRKIVDQGLASRAVQVGQSGKTVTPKLYIAVGIDGAIQHVEGLKNVEHIISVNLNKNAPICALSDIVVQGDAGQFVDRLIERINR